MNYINWKNKSSDEIDGLLICELPPITKPKMRVKETAIDGVDGSTFEELGYESYDKTIKIGLRNNFDIDEVIDYFTGEGNITFSNEEDKYYKAKIINQIDFNRLLRFRTADIKFRVQPFKYSAEEIKKTYEAVSTASGNSSVSLTNVIADNFNKISVYGKSTQGANPSPSNPQTITNITGNTEVKVCGKNLLDNKMSNTITLNGVTFTKNNDKSITLNGTATTTMYININVGNQGNNYFTLKAGETYTSYLKGSISGVKFKTRSVSQNLHLLSTGNGIQIKSEVYNYDTDNQCYSYLEIASGTIFNNITLYPMILKGTYTLNETYEAYQGQTLTINLGANELCSIGDIQDELVIQNGNAKIIKRIGKVVFDGSENWQDTLRPYYSLTLTTISPSPKANSQLISNNFAYAGGEGRTGIWCGTYAIAINTLNLPSEITSAQTLKTWLSTHNTTVYYELATPTEIDLGSITQPTTYAGTTNVSNNKSADMTAIGYKVRTFSVTNQGNYKSKPLIKITGSGTIEFKLENVTIFSYTFPTGDTYVEIDSDKQDAYIENTLKNRNMNGEFPILKIGRNIISWTGTITNIEVSDYSRWL